MDHTLKSAGSQQQGTTRGAGAHTTVIPQVRPSQDWLSPCGGALTLEGLMMGVSHDAYTQVNIPACNKMSEKVQCRSKLKDV